MAFCNFECNITSAQQRREAKPKKSALSPFTFQLVFVQLLGYREGHEESLRGDTILLACIIRGRGMPLPRSLKGPRGGISLKSRKFRFFSLPPHSRQWGMQKK